MVDYDNFTMVWEQKLAGEQCDCLAFSPDGRCVRLCLLPLPSHQAIAHKPLRSYLAVGSWDQALYIVMAADGTVRKKFTVLPAVVL